MMTDPKQSLLDFAPLDESLRGALQEAIDQKTKPLGALGRLEALALQMGLIQQTLTPRIERPTIVVFAADHGITAEGVSPYPSEVTAQMVANFLAGGAAINVFAKANRLHLDVIDAGVAHPIPTDRQPRDFRIAPGTANARHQPAMTDPQLDQCLRAGITIVDEHHAQGCNVIGFGEMGIGNTSAASLIMSCLTELPIEQCTGRGTGLDDAGLVHKQSVLGAALTRISNEGELTPWRVLVQCGGFEIAMMCGAILRAAQLRMCVIVDGFIASAAALVALRVAPPTEPFLVFAHRSDESGHQTMLNHLGVEPLLDLDMRLGEGTGAALALPLLQAAVDFLNDMASFASAGVSERSD
ncbi:MAG: nicotinate-nucleotide--dimethylbenzimidazole phosphoribosyltransferase [Pseudomonadota bacterium]